MRQIVINELRDEDLKKIEKFLQEQAEKGALEGMYWLPIPEQKLAEAQKGHGECGPFAFAIEVGQESVTLELLIRSKANLHCSCTAYATEAQRNFLLQFFDRLINDTEIRI